MEHAIPLGLKRFINVVGIILIVIGLPFTVNLFCGVPLMSFNSYGDEAAYYGVFSLLAFALTMGAGLAMFMHSNRSIQKKPSKPLKFFPIPLMVGAFGLLIVFGLFFSNADAASGIFFPPILLALAALPPLWSVAWFAGKDEGERMKDEGRRLNDEGKIQNSEIGKTDDEGEAQNADERMAKKDEVENQKSKIENRMTWRRGMMAFIGGATIGVFLALVLEIILPTIVLSLAFNLSKVVLDSVSALFDALAGSDVARTLTDRGFIYLFIQLALIAPLAEEFAKPLAIIPLLKKSNRRDAFLLGALAGAGFAALENIVYAMGGFDMWGGVLLLRSLGGALHPLGAGLMALAWRDVLNNEQAASSNWFTRFAIAVGVHAAWNGGSLLVITLGVGLWREIGILGISAAGTTLAFLILLGISALWMGRVFGHGESLNLFPDKTDASLPPSERTLAIWALACLTVIVPIGVTGLSLWLR